MANCWKWKFAHNWDTFAFGVLAGENCLAFLFGPFALIFFLDEGGREDE